MKQSIREELQENENEQEFPYQLKTNDEIICDIIEFGYGECEFHTLDINRLVVESERTIELMKKFEHLKMKHELPNDNHSEFNEGYVKAMCHAINQLKLI